MKPILWQSDNICCILINTMCVISFESSIWAMSIIDRINSYENRCSRNLVTRYIYMNWIIKFKVIVILSFVLNMIIYCDKYFFISDNIGNLYTLLVSRHFPDPRTRPSFLWYTSSPHTRAITNPISLYNTIRFLSAVWVNWRKCNFYSISGFIFRFL